MSCMAGVCGDGSDSRIKYSSRNKQHVGKDAAENAVLLLICLDLLQILFSGIFMKENYFDMFFIVYQGSEVTSDS